MEISLRLLNFLSLSHHQEPNWVPTESYTPRWWKLDEDNYSQNKT